MKVNFRKEITKVLKSIEGKRILNIINNKSIILININDTYIELHTTVRFIKGHTIVLSNRDFYFVNNEGMNNFNLNYQMFSRLFLNKRILHAMINNFGDINIILEDSLRIQIIVDRGYENFFVNDELYRVYLESDKTIYIIRNNKRLEIIDKE